MSILAPTPAILLVIYALSAYVASAVPAPDNTAPSTQQFGKWAGVKIFLFDDTNCGQSYIYPEPGTEVVSILDGNLSCGKMLHSDFTFQYYNLSRFRRRSDSIGVIPVRPARCLYQGFQTSVERSYRPQVQTQIGARYTMEVATYLASEQRYVTMLGKKIISHEN